MRRAAGENLEVEMNVTTDDLGNGESEQVTPPRKVACDESRLSVGKKQGAGTQPGSRVRADWGEHPKKGTCRDRQS